MEKSLRLGRVTVLELFLVLRMRRSSNGTFNNMGRLLGHTSCYRGKRVRVKLRSGEVFLDRFKERTDKHVIFYGAGKIRKADIETFGIYRPNQSDAV